jgi:hypothetical protein
MVVRPLYDAGRHYIYGDCACNPRTEPVIDEGRVQGHLIVHNSFDGQEEEVYLGGPV